jgi:HPt (histidine-containing phosphotransfer) domain-containing protein
MEPIRSQYEDDADMLELVLEFASALPSRIQRLEELLAQGDFEELERMAHQLKGAGGGYGFPQITEVAAVLELALREGADPARVKQSAALLSETLRAVKVPEAS